MPRSATYRASVAAARAAGFAVRRIEPFLAPSLQRSVGGDERPVFEDADLVGENVHLEYAPPGRVGHAVEIAADTDHAFVRSPALELQHRPVGHGRQGFERSPLLGESLADDPVGGRVHARISGRIEPMTELLVKVVEIAERAAKEEVLADISERPLDLALGLGPIGPAGARLETVMAGEVDEGAVVDDEAIGRPRR
jgi:hypothetical protein